MLVVVLVVVDVGVGVSWGSWKWWDSVGGNSAIGWREEEREKEEKEQEGVGDKPATCRSFGWRQRALHFSENREKQGREKWKGMLVQLGARLENDGGK